MKRVMLLGLACFALFGCGEKGHWRNAFRGLGVYAKRPKSKMEKWNFSGFRRDQKRKSFNYIQNLWRVINEREGNDLTKGDWYSVSSNLSIQDVKNLNISEFSRSYISSKFEYISDKEYKHTLIIEKVYKSLSEEEQTKDNSRQKIEENCIKVVH